MAPDGGRSIQNCLYFWAKAPKYAHKKAPIGRLPMRGFEPPACKNPPVIRPNLPFLAKNPPHTKCVSLIGNPGRILWVTNCSLLYLFCGLLFCFSHPNHYLSDRYVIGYSSYAGQVPTGPVVGRNCSIQCATCCLYC